MFKRKRNHVTAYILSATFLLSASMALPAAAAPGFDPDYYASTNPDVAAACGTDAQALLNHYLTYGMKEGRLPCAGARPGEAVDETADNTSDNTSADFDAEYYASKYPDVAAACGTDAQALLNHYLSFGVKEGRYPNAGAEPAAKAEGNTNASSEQGTAFEPVPINQLANLSSLKKKMTDEEFSQAYNKALEIVTPYANLSREEQLRGIAVSLRQMFDSGMSYSMSTPHYNDAYGYFVLNTASCAGCARATGLCLNILGIPYEHVNENQYTHQWCRVNVNGVYWICDAYGLTCGPEPGPYQHPYL